MEEEFPYMNLCDEDLPASSRETGSRPTMSTILDTMCYLGPMSEETQELNGTSRLNDVLAGNNIVNRRKSDSNIHGEICQLPKSPSAGPPSPPPTLRRTRSEPALPTFRAWEDNKGQELNEARKSKTSSRSSSPDYYELLDTSWLWNTDPQLSPVPSYNINKNLEDTECTTASDDSDTSEDSFSCLQETTSHNSAAHDAEEAETEETCSTILFSFSSMAELCFTDDSTSIGMSETQYDAEVTASNSNSTDLKKTDLEHSERIHAIDTLHSPLRTNTAVEIIDEITVEESVFISSKDQAQEEATPSKKKHRRGWKGVKRRIRHLFRNLCSCLLTPKTEDTFPR